VVGRGATGARNMLPVTTPLMRDPMEERDALTAPATMVMGNYVTKHMAGADTRGVAKKATGGVSATNAGDTDLYQVIVPLIYT
tara:strand:- start:59 stop:307 length:249 start_codon:yes stop_codon:yes gene_type:complete